LRRHTRAVGDAKAIPFIASCRRCSGPKRKAVRTTQTDSAGRFAIKNVTGHYVIRMKTPNYSIVSREIFVQLELVTQIAGNRLYVILGPGQCSDDCSTVFTSKNDFDKALRHSAGPK